jgi:hypothetical protein
VDWPRTTDGERSRHARHSSLMLRFESTSGRYQRVSCSVLCICT